MYTANKIADWILSKVDVENGDSITPLKLQKLIYYCQAWHLTIFKSSLFEEPIEAWANGPVVPSVYARFAAICKDCTIDIRNLELDVPKFEDHSIELLEEVFSIYNEHSGGYLKNLTHSEKPWLDARGETPLYAKSEAVISNDSMIDYYGKLNVKKENA